MSHFRRLVALAAVGVISVAGVACGGDDGGAAEQDQQPADDGETGGDDGGGLDY